MTNIAERNQRAGPHIQPISRRHFSACTAGKSKPNLLIDIATTDGR